jgi:hypothetical protein
MMRIFAYSTVIALLAAVPVSAQNWGSVKGKVVWDDPNLPKPTPANVDKDQPHCLAKGALLKDEVVVDPKSKGVRNVMVWLADPAGGKLPINPKLAAVPKDKVVIDQPMCLFEPRVTMLRQGQTLVVKNSAPVTHNTRITGNNEINGTINLTIPPGQNIEKVLKAEPRPLQLACDIHGWMAGRIAVFDHPYFALTDKDGKFEIKDAPAGNFVIYINHEKAGWLHTPRERTGNIGGSKGQAVAIPAGGALDLGTIKLKPEYLK